MHSITNIPNSSKFEIISYENQEKASKDNIIYSRPHNLHHSRSLCYNNSTKNLLANNININNNFNINIHNNNSNINENNSKLQSPIYSYSRPVSKISNYNVSNNFSDNYKNIIKKAIYSYNNILLQKNIYDKNFSINSTRNKNENRIEIPTTRYSRLNKEKKSNIPILLKNASMKLFQNYSSYLKNTKDQNSFKNTSRIGSSEQINFDINISKDRPYSGIPSYRKINGVSPH